MITVVGDPARDFLPEAAKDTLDSAYGPRDGDWRRTRASPREWRGYSECVIIATAMARPSALVRWNRGGRGSREDAAACDTAPYGGLGFDVCVPIC